MNIIIIFIMEMIIIMKLTLIIRTVTGGMLMMMDLIIMNVKAHMNGVTVLVLTLNKNGGIKMMVLLMFFTLVKVLYVKLVTMILLIGLLTVMMQ